MQIRVRDLGYVTAAPALAARRVGLAAQDCLGEPYRQSLFADTVGAVEKQARRQRTSADACREATPQGIVSVKIDDWHIEIW
jgi:hypothetical protein